MKVDRCRRIELILADASQIVLSEKEGTIELARWKMIRKRIANLTEDEIYEFMTTLVNFEHRQSDVYRGKVTNGMLVPILKMMAVNTQRNIAVYNQVKYQYQKYVDKMADHSLINRMVKVGKVFRQLSQVRKAYPLAQRFAQSSMLYSKSKDTYDARIEFYNLVVNFNRMIERFDDKELKMLKDKCKFFDFVHSKKEHQISMCETYKMAREQADEFLQIKNDVNANQKII